MVETDVKRKTKAVIRTKKEAYIKELNNSINEDRIAHGKKPLKFEEAPVETEKEEYEDYFDDDENKKSDPESGFMHRDRKPKGFFYLDHRTVDSKNNIITDTYVTPGNVNDVKPYIDRLLYQKETFGFNVKTVGTGFATAVCAELRRLKNNAYSPQRCRI